MTPDELKNRIPENEFVFLTSRSSGPGGQNVNKVNTKVELRFDFLNSSGLSDDEKSLIREKLKGRIISSGEIVIRSQSERTQPGNKKKAIERLFVLMAEAITENPERKPTKPSGKSKAERLEDKKKRARIKSLRRDDLKSSDIE